MNIAQGLRASKITVVCLAVISSQALSGEPVFEIFDQVCLGTASQSEEIHDAMERLTDWKAMPSSNQEILHYLDNREVWYLKGESEAGVLAVGNLPIETSMDPWFCMLAMPREDLTINEASRFLLEAGGKPAYPEGESHSESPTFGFLFGENWVYVGAQILPSQTHIQFMVLDMHDESVRAAIKAAN